jgi:hypothetical protein
LYAFLISPMHATFPAHLFLLHTRVDNEIYAYNNKHSRKTQRVMVAKLTILTHKTVPQLHLVAESCTICSSRSSRPVRELLGTPSHDHPNEIWWWVQIMKLLLYNFHRPPITSFILGPNILLSTMFSRNFSLHHHVRNGSGVYPASYPMGTRGSFRGGKAAGVWSWPLTSI